MASSSSLTADYLDEVARRGMAATELPEAARRSFDMPATSFLGRCLTRPVFLGHADFTRLSYQMSRMQDALFRLPDRLFGGDLAAFARAVGMTQTQVSAIMRGSGRAPSRLARADLYPDGSGFRLMEVNTGSALGGLDNGLLNRAFLTHPVVADFVAAHELSYVDTMAAVAQTLLAECEIPDGDQPLIAAADWPASFATLEPQLRYSAAQLAAHGLNVVACHLGQLSVRGGRVWLEGQDRPVDVIYRLFLIEDLLDPGGAALIDPVLDAAERGEVTIFAPMDAELYGSKGALALLSDEANRHLFTADELASLDAILPWTRIVRPGPVTVNGQSADLAEYAAAQREDLILKPTLMHGGIGVVPGWLADADEWSRQLKAAMDESFVLQRRIRPVPQLFPADGGPQSWVVTYDVFLGVHDYSGARIRAKAEVDDVVVNMATGATATCCFHQAQP